MENQIVALDFSITYKIVPHLSMQNIRWINGSLVALVSTALLGRNVSVLYHINMTVPFFFLFLDCFHCFSKHIEGRYAKPQPDKLTVILHTGSTP